MLRNIGNSRSIPNNNLEETVLKIFNETGVTVNSRDVEACHRLNQKANPKKVIAEKRCGSGNEQQKEVEKHETSKYLFTIWL